MQGVYVKIPMGMMTGSESAPKDLGCTDLIASLFALRGTVMDWGNWLLQGAVARRGYQSAIDTMAGQIKNDVSAGKLTVGRAVQDAVNAPKYLTTINAEY